jgi:hypothetical protein
VPRTEIVSAAIDALYQHRVPPSFDVLSPVSLIRQFRIKHYIGVVAVEKWHFLKRAQQRANPRISTRCDGLELRGLYRSSVFRCEPSPIHKVGIFGIR